MVQAALTQIEPYAESVCELSLPRRACDFTVLVTPSAISTVNAYQIRGEPTIIFTQPLMNTFRNEDEVAFVYAHEASHYILRHGELRQAREDEGAQLLRELSLQRNSRISDQQQIDQQSAAVISEINSKYSLLEELQADRLGAEIAAVAGFDPIAGVKIFEQTGDHSHAKVLPSHPRNAQRIARIRDVYK